MLLSQGGKQAWGVFTWAFSKRFLTIDFNGPCEHYPEVKAVVSQHSYVPLLCTARSFAHSTHNFICPALLAHLLTALMGSFTPALHCSLVRNREERDFQSVPQSVPYCVNVTSVNVDEYWWTQIFTFQFWSNSAQRAPRHVPWETLRWKASWLFLIVSKKIQTHFFCFAWLQKWSSLRCKTRSSKD